MSIKQIKSCLVISYGPVPTPQYQTVEGGGMRAWGLADGLIANGIDVTVGINAGFPQEYSEHESIKLVNWNLDAEFIRLINSFDAVLISYCMGDPSVFVADNINDDIQLILDAYVPIYIEVSARDSKDVETEYVNYMADVGRFNKVLKRGDYFLYANDAQELLYSGVLSALGVINPKSYRETRLIKAPFGIHRTPAIAKGNPYAELGIGNDDFVVLWFGGIYPWFRIEEYLETIKLLSKEKSTKFVFVGGKNPFNPNPDFSRQYDTAVAFAKDNKLIEKQVFFVDWVDFQDRVDWFAHADVIVSINQPGEENKYSWRTRVMDYIWGEVVTISNGGDPLSEELIANDAAICLPKLDSATLAEAIRTAEKDQTSLKKMKRNVILLKEKYFWDVVTKDIAQLITAGELPYLNEQPLRSQLGAPSDLILQSAVVVPGKLTRIASLPLKVARKAKQKGVIRTAKIAASVLKAQLKSKSPVPRQPQFIFISHPINNTGGAIVLLQIIEEYAKKYGSNRVRVIAPGIERSQRIYLKRLGITVEQAVFGVGFRFIRLQLNLQKDDFVLMNTSAIYDNYRDFVLLWLRNKRLSHAYWFIHEDIAQLPFVHKEFFDPRNLAQTAKLVNGGSLSLLFPSKRTASEYAELIGIKETHTINLHVEVDEALKKERTETDFNNLNFLISGTPSDGRKGQLLALSALQEFVSNYQRKDPSAYRPFTLHLVAIADDYVSQQIRWIAESTLGENVKIYESLPKEEALEVTRLCNTVICCSLNETFGLYIAEGMLMGHVVLRNNSAGVDEQLVDGKNGLLIDHTDIPKFATSLETLLNRKKTSNKQLLSMSKASRVIIGEYGKHSYVSQIEKTE